MAPNTLMVIGDWQKDSSLRGTFNAARTDQTMKFRAELQYAFQLIKNVEALQRCDPDTIRTSLLDVAFSGLSLSPSRALAYLVPYGTTCTFKPSYRGYEYLVQKAGTIKRIQANLVHAQDKFKVWTDETGRHLNHAETFKGAVTAAYVIASYANGETHVEVMTIEDLNAVQKQAEKQGPAHPWHGPWKGEMQKKAVIRRAAKHWPSDAPLQHAVDVMDRFDPLFTKEDKPVDSEAGELLITSDQEMQLHACMTGFGLDEKAADTWLHRKAEALGYQSINELPANLFEDVKAFLSDRAKTYVAAQK